MRGKLRDKRDTKYDRSKREVMVSRRPLRRDNRNLQLQQFASDENGDELMEENEPIIIEEHL